MYTMQIKENGSRMYWVAETAHFSFSTDLYIKQKYVDTQNTQSVYRH